jgi:hypothetical protein
VAKLRKVTVQRAAARREQAEARQAARRQFQAASAHAGFGWQLLTHAVVGELDDQAYTELAIAWKSPATAQLLESPLRPVVLRSLWAIVTSSRVMPQEPKLAELAKSALQQTRPWLDDARGAVTESLADPERVLGLLYATLSLPGEDSQRAECIQVLLSVPEDQPAVAGLRRVAAQLLDPTSPVDAAWITELLNNQAGPDTVVLAGLACRASGAQAWQSFREVARHILSHSGIDGDVVVLVNQLGMLPVEMATR